MHPTRRQKQILEILRSHIAREGRSPTLARIARRCGLASPATVHKHLSLLEQRGLLRRRRRGRRGEITLRPAAYSTAAVELPLLGRIAAGRPIEAIVEPESIPVPRALVGRGRAYVLRVRGDSMVDEGIRDGDYIVVESRDHARDGEVVVALLEGREATLKVLRRGRRGLVLEPANPSMRPIRIRGRSIVIQGVVTGLLRRYT
ncbi:MAG: transcriptional repressor LexA [Acidobacteriota bacterium]